MLPIKNFQTGGILNASSYGLDPDLYEPLTQEEFDQQEADYFGVPVGDLPKLRQERAGITGIPAAQPMVAQTSQPMVPQTSQPAPYVTGATTQTVSRDPALQQLLFGLDGEGGFIPGAMRAAERTFFDEEGRPVIVPQEVAGLTEDQLAAAQSARDLVGVQDRFLTESEEAARQGVEGLLGSLRQGRGLTALSTRDLLNRLGESEQLIRGTTEAYDPSMTQQFMDPFEDAVVQQTIDDVIKQANIADIAQTARNIRAGGESAFGSRARLSKDEMSEALGRGLAKEIAGIRSRGFSEAQQTGLGEFARQQQAARTAASGLAGLSGQRFGAGTGLGQTLVDFGQRGQQAQTGFGGFLQNLGTQAQQAGLGGINLLSTFGGQQQQQQQQLLDAQRANALQAQQAPLQQFQSLLPFVTTAAQTAGTQTQAQQFAPPPSPVMTGLGVGLSTLGGIGGLLNQQRAV